MGSPTLLFNMTKEQLEACREIIKILNRASFEVTGPELVDFSNKLKAFAKVLVEVELSLKKEE